LEFLDFLDSGHLYGEVAVGARNLTQSVDWYCANLNLVEGTIDGDEAILGYRGGKSRSLIPLITLVQIPVGKSEAPVERHPILFSRNLGKSREGLLRNGVITGPIQNDSGGNHFFEFQDLDGNRIEVCLEPGRMLR